VAIPQKRSNPNSPGVPAKNGFFSDPGFDTVFHSWGCYLLGVQLWDAAIFTHHDITQAPLPFPTFSHLPHSKQCRGCSLSTAPHLRGGGGGGFI
jgi:hypothetical protein